MFDAILVPTDGSAIALRAAERAAEFAERFDAELHLLTVADPQAAAGVFSAGGVDREFVDRLEAQARDIVESVERTLEGLDAVETAVLTGYPPEQILDYADGHGIDLVVMGTRGRTGLGRYVLGSVTERVLRNADVPVLTVGGDAETAPADDYGEVLIPTDGSDPAAAAVDAGIAVAGAFDARLHAVNVVDLGDVGTFSTFRPPEDLIARLRSEGERATGMVADRAREAELDAVTAVEVGRPPSRLLAYARENDVDLIAMGTTGRSGIGQHLLGSTTERIIRRSEVPVLAVSATDGTTD